MSPAVEISVIIPTYNESKNIARLVKVLARKLAKYRFEILVVDDHSPDGTEQAIKEITQKQRRIRFLPHPPPRGLSESILYGVKKAKGKVLVGMDADFNHDPKVITKLIKKITDENFNLAVASRFIAGGGMDDKVRYYCTYLFNLFLRTVLGFPMTDNASGYYAIKTAKLKKMPLAHIFRGYGEYHLRLVYLAKETGLKAAEVPVYYQKRKYGQSKSNLWQMLFKYLGVATALRFHW